MMNYKVVLKPIPSLFGQEIWYFLSIFWRQSSFIAISNQWENWFLIFFVFFNLSGLMGGHQALRILQIHLSLLPILFFDKFLWWSVHNYGFLLFFLKSFLASKTEFLRFIPIFLIFLKFFNVISSFLTKVGAVNPPLPTALNNAIWPVLDKWFSSKHNLSCDCKSEWL